MNRTNHACILIGICIAAIFANGELARGQLNRFFSVNDHVLSFETMCDVSDCREILFLNVGTRPITITKIDIPSFPFVIDPTLPVTVPQSIRPGDTARARVCYRPNTPESADVGRLVLTIDTGSAERPAFDTLRFSGISRSAMLEITPSTYDFGSMTIGGLKCTMITIRNSGNDSIDLSLLDPLLAPFAPETLPKRLIPPDEEAQVQICFSPLAIGTFVDTFSLNNGGCREPATFVVRGRGLKPVTNIGPLLEVLSVDFDTTLCGTTKCGTLTVRNIGSDPMRVEQIGQVPPPFSGAISPSPLIIEAGGEGTFTICYAPREVPSVDSATIDIVADNRVPMSIAAVFDISGSMLNPFGNLGGTRITAANAAGQLFIGSLVNEPDLGIVDEAAVYRFSDVPDYLRLQDYTSDLVALQNAVPDTTMNGFTCIYNAIVRVCADLETRNVSGRRVLVLLTDGKNDCPSSTESVDDAVAAAQRSGIRIYTIGIGSIDRTALTQLAQQTGGFFSEALDPEDLNRSYERIANDLSKSQPSFFTLRGRSVAPNLEVSVASLAFDSVRVGNSRCRTLVLRNTGDAVLPITSYVRPSVHYTVTPGTIPDIAPGDSVEVRVCFAPGLLRGIDSIITFGYTHCTPQSTSVTLSGTGYDSVVIDMDGSYVAHPGGIITVPIRLTGRIPSAYAVDSLSLVFGYNKTVLFPEIPSAPLAATGTPADAMTVQRAEPTYGAQDARLAVTFTGGRLTSTRPDTLLAELNLIALHGNSLTSPIELLEASFADGNPKVGIRSGANFLADSLCFQEERLVDASARFGPTMKLVSLEKGRAVIRIVLPEQSRMRGDLFDQLGGHVGAAFDEERGPGEYEAAIDLSELPAGSYWLRLLTNDNGQQVMNVIVRN